jgi:hypothetical protein
MIGRRRARMAPRRCKTRGAQYLIMRATRRTASASARSALRRATLLDWLAFLMLLAGSVVWPH